MKKYSALLAVLLTFVALASTATAAVVFTDDFESGTLANWTSTSTTGGRIYTISTATNIVPAGGTTSALLTNSVSRMHHNLIADNGGFEVSGHVIYTCYIYDDGGISSGNGNIAWVEVRGYSAGTGLPNGGTTASGGLSQLIAMGKASSGFVYIAGDPYDGTKYQGRSIAGVFAGAGFGTWFNLNDPGAPSRSVGWHKFQVEQLEDGTTLKFYVDDILSRTILGNAVQSWDTLIGGAGLGTGQAANNSANYLDGISVETFADTNAPTVRLAYGGFNSNEVNIIFSEAVSDTATNAGNYSLSDGLTVLSVERTSASSVRLNTSAQTPGSNYTVTINSVLDLAFNRQDLAPNAIAANTTASFTALAAPQFFANFNDAAVPPNTAVYGNAVVSSTGGVGNSGMLNLTDPLATRSGSFIIEDLNAGQLINSFVATFRVRIGGGSSPPADGFSFNLASDLPNSTFPLDGAGNGLSIIFDTFNNGTDASSSRAPEAPAVDVKVGGAFVAHTNVGLLLRTGTSFVDVFIQANVDGKLTLAINGSLIFSNLVVYTNKIGGRFGLGGVTGGSFESHFIDDLGISTVPITDTDPPTIVSVAGKDVAGCSSLNSVRIAFSEAIGGSGDESSNYAFDGGLEVQTVTRINPSTVVLNTTPQTPGTIYTLTVNDLADTAPIPNPIAPNTQVSFTAFTAPTAKFYTEFCTLPPNTTLYGTANLNEGYLKLTSATANQLGAFVVNDLDAGQSVVAFVATFKARVGGGTGADGFSFNFASDLTTDFAEEGAGSGLTVSFDSFNNGANEAPAIEVKFGGVSISNRLVNYVRTGSDFVDVTIRADPDGTVDVIYGTNVVFTNLVSAYTPIAGGRFGLGARTGASFDNHWIDNLTINTVTACGPLSVARFNSDVVVSWGSACRLQSSTNVAGPYLNVPGATSPHTNATPAEQKFFRLQSN
ncbi:MAG TPA: hypothetical protein VGF13_20325 [Verrucomicrobiae bacterium]